jgi:prefoldin subunit 5
MDESEKILDETVNKLLEKIDGYDKRISSLVSDISKLQSRMDLTIRPIQVL